MPCEECRELAAQPIASPQELLNVLQVAAQEVDRGVLRPLPAADLSLREREALESIYAADVMPGTVDYRFECRLCGDRFRLTARTSDGVGAWSREP